MRRVFIGIFLALFMISLLPPGQAEAAFNFYGRAEGQSYFKGNFPASGWYVFNSTPDLPYEGITPDWQTVPITVDVFIDQFSKRLNSTTNHNRARAAATIMMMLGVNGPDPIFDGPSPDRWRNGVTVAQSRFAEWEALVRYYDSRGWVNFNDLYTASSPMDWLGAYDGINVNPHPDMMAVKLAGLVFANEPSITFYNPNGTQFNILKKCVNMAGEVMALQTFDLRPNLQPAFAGSEVIRGETYTLTPSVSNLGTLSSAPFTLSARETSTPSKIQSGAITSSSASVTSYSFDSSTKVWSWAYGNGLSASNDVLTAALNFTVSPTAAPGSSICFTATASPSSALPGSSATTSPPLCFTVALLRHPSLVGRGADIHAGGGTGDGCSIDTAKGFIRGNPDSGSFGEHSVSGGEITGTGSTIFGFGSKGAQGSTSLTFNEGGSGLDTGRYGPVCRENLAEAFAAMPAGAVTDISGPLNLSTYTSGTHILRYSGGGDLVISGSIGPNAKVSVYSPGNIIIASNMIQPNAYSALGIVSDGDIIINDNVAQIYAYLFAKDQIRTCSSDYCAGTLTVHGLMSANSYIFGRLGSGVGGAQGERVQYRGAFLFNPPPGFTGVRAGGTYRPNYGGEQAPRY